MLARGKGVFTSFGAYGYRELGLLPATAPALFPSARFGNGLLYAVDGEDVSTVVEVAAGVSEVGASRKSVGIDDQVAEAG